MRTAVYLRWMLGPALAGLALVAAFNFAVDPLQFYRRASLYPPQYSANQRYQNAALVRTHAFDTVVLGTSHMENARPSVVEAALGGKVLKLAVAGSALREQTQLAHMALSRGTLRRVIWGLDYSSFTVLDRVLDDYGPFPRHLYRGALGAAGPYLLSWDTLGDSLAALQATAPGDLDALNSWPDYEYSTARVHAAWDDMGARWTPALRQRWAAAVPGWPAMRAALDDELFALARANPQVRFDFVFVPYTMLEYANDFRVDDARFFQRIALQAAAGELAAGVPNVRVWDFSGDATISARLDQYKDLAHSRPEVLHALLARLVGEPPAADPRAIAFQLRGYLDAVCAPDAVDRERFCPPRVVCGRQRLAAWLDAGASLHALPLTALDACPRGG